MDRIPFDQLNDLIAAARVKVEPGTRWQHYKGNEYIVEHVALTEDTNEVVIVYSAISHPTVSFVRPLKRWLEMVDWNEQRLPRYTKIF